MHEPVLSSFHGREQEATTLFLPVMNFKESTDHQMRLSSYPSIKPYEVHEVADFGEL